MEVSKIIMKGAIDGIVENQFLLGEKYFFGVGETRNVLLAASWYKEAAKRGHVSAMYMYGYILLSGAAGKVEMKKGAWFIKRAAAKNHPKAIILLAENYFYGYGVKRDEKKAFKTWQKGARMGLAEAEYYLGLCYGKGIYVKQDFIEAKRHLYKALENGFDIAREAVDDFASDIKKKPLKYKIVA